MPLHAWRSKILGLCTSGFLCLALGACAQDPRTVDASESPASARASDAPESETRSPDSTLAKAVDLSCRVENDCVVKNIGNCCGAMPACVNRTSEPDPAQVQADCASEGRAGVCGFQELSGCQCVEARCVGVPGASGEDVR